MSTTGDSGFGKVTIVNGRSPKTDPGGKPHNSSADRTPLTSSVAFRDWVKADMEYKENSPRQKFS